MNDGQSTATRLSSVRHTLIETGSTPLQLRMSTRLRLNDRMVVATIEDAALKAQIHRNVVMERDADLGTDRASRSKKRKKPTRRTQRMMDRILQLEADGADHTGVEIDGLLAGIARELGYSEEDVSTLHPKTGRSVFANDGDWAKAEMTAERLHEVVDTTVHWEGGTRRECNVYRITSRGLDELRKRG